MGMSGDANGCGACSKYCLFAVNSVIFVGALVLLGLGIWSLADRSFVNELLGTNLLSGTVYVLIGAAIVICIISFLGCYGAGREVKSMLLFYFVFVFLIFVVILVGSILGYVFREKVIQTMRQEMYSSLPYYGNRRDITLAWDETQTRLKCCGVESYRDWYGSIPESCCQETYGGQRKPCIDAPSPLTLHINGCRNVTTEFVRQHASVIAGAGITVAVFLLFAQIFALILFKSIE